jgi:hypothetical protein
MRPAYLAFETVPNSVTGKNVIHFLKKDSSRSRSSNSHEDFLVGIVDVEILRKKLTWPIEKTMLDERTGNGMKLFKLQCFSGVSCS